MLFSAFTVVLYLLVFVDRWRLPLRRARTILLVLAGADFLVLIWIFSVIEDLRVAAGVAMLVSMVALLVVLLLAPWRGGLLLFVVATAFLGGCVPYYILRGSYQAKFLAQVLAETIIFLLMYRYFRPLFQSAILTGKAVWPLVSLVPMAFCLVHLAIVGNRLAGGSGSGGPGNSPLDGVPITALRMMMIVLPACTYLLLYGFFGVLDRQYQVHRENLLRNAQLDAMERREREGQRLRD